MRFVMVGSLLFGCLVAIACVGDDPELGGALPDASTSSGGDGSGGGGGVSSGGTSGGGTSGGASSSGGGTTCTEGFGNCDDSADGTCETELRGNATHCGQCGRACGGAATCNAGTCTAETIADGLAQPFGLAVAGARAAWIERPALRGCLIDGCDTPTVLHDLETDAGYQPFGSPSQLAIVDETIYFSRCLLGGVQECGVARCAIQGCKTYGYDFLSTNDDRRANVLGSGPGAIYTYAQLGRGLLRTDLMSNAASDFPAGVVEHFQDFFADADQFVYVDDDDNIAENTGGVFRCPSGGCTGATTRQRLLPPPVRHLAVAAGTAFTSEGPPGAARLLSCSIADCGTTTQVLANGQPFVAGIAADATDVYWVTTGAADPSANALAIGTLQRCSLPACAGGPVTVAQNLVNPVSVKVDAKYVYWMTYGSTSSPTGTFARQRR